LEEAKIKPHRCRYWLNPKVADQPDFDEKVEKLCGAYGNAQKLRLEGGHTISCDEKTGIQALERIAPSKPVRPGTEEKIEFEYIRHGTTCLIASFDVATGQVKPSLGLTRNEEDFAAHIESNVETDPEAVWHFIVDQLNTHFSESLVRLVAKFERLTIDLGTKGKSGILESAEARRSFLTAPERRIRFFYTPKHCSWLNQVECWFSILVRRALKRASFTSVANLNKSILDFVAYFNAVLAKPFRWTYTGRALQT
jgi:transposase